METPYQTYRRLVELVLQCDIAYYIRNDALMSDADYDATVLRIQHFEHQHPTWKTHDSPSVRIGAPGEKADYPHLYRMYSLHKVYSTAALRTWCMKRTPDETVLYSSVKLDGLAVDFQYDEHGTLVRVLTRGTDGHRGQDITQQVLYTVEKHHYLKALPESGIRAGVTNIYGEVTLDKATYDTLKQTHHTTYVSLRNAASGILTGQDVSTAVKGCLSFHAYDIRPYTAYTTYSGVIAWLQSVGLEVPSGSRVLCLDDLNDIVQYETEQRNAYPYEIDGIVFRVDDLTAFTKMGYSDHDPRGAVAYKFAPRGTIATVHHIERRISRDGKLTPVAILDPPACITGVTIRAVTLHNEDHVAALGVSAGCTVSLVRQGDVIPKILKVVTPGTDEEEDDIHCGYCGEPAVRDGLYYRCPNETCPGRISVSLAWFAGKYGVNIKGIGQSTWEDLVDAKRITRFRDILTLTAADFPRGGEQAVRAIRTAKQHITPEKYLIACGIEGLGKVNARALTAQLSVSAATAVWNHLVHDTTYPAVRTYFLHPDHQADLIAWLSV